MLTSPSKKQIPELGRVVILGVFALAVLSSASAFGTVIPVAGDPSWEGRGRRTLNPSRMNALTANTTIAGGTLSPRSGPAIWDGGVGNWFSTPTNWFCIQGGHPIPCGPPDGPQWDVNIGIPESMAQRS
jgi:hypothetical protein